MNHTIILTYLLKTFFINRWSPEASKSFSRV